MKPEEIKALVGNGTYRGNPLKARLIETHISWILLSGRYAFKIKKPVKLSFLDFSTLRKRKLFCEKELMLNRRFSGIYLGVEPVRKQGKKIAIGGIDGKIIEYAVLMKRMNARKQMDNMLRGGKVTAEHLEALAKELATFHRNALINDRPFDSEAAKRTFNDLRNAGSFLAGHVENDIQAKIDAAIDFSNRFIDLAADRMSERVRLGFTRDLHGDLHCGNIFLYKKPVIFDCIEYNEAFRQIDLLSELAFLCMDMESHGQFMAAQTFMARYCRLVPCLLTKQDHAIFLYYKCFRANVRAKVHAISARQATDRNDLTRQLDRVGLYVTLMHRYIGEIASYTEHTHR